MLDALDLDLKLTKADYKAQLHDLKLELRTLQYEFWQAGLKAVIVLEGWAAAGKGNIVKKLSKSTDPRGVKVHPIWPATSEERAYPFLWRFWQVLPANGKVGVFYHSWYTRVLEDRLFGRIPDHQVSAALRDINSFERQLADDGHVVLKFWLHLDRKELRKRLKKYGKDPLVSWRVRPEDWLQVDNYDDYAAHAEAAIASTSTGVAPWTLVEANDKRWGRLKVLSSVVAGLREALDRHALAQQQSAPSLPPQDQLAVGEPDWLDRVDLSQSLNKDDYGDRLEAAQTEWYVLQKDIFERKLPIIALFEGWDAAGKGGAIARLTDVLDPRSFAVHSIAAPSDEAKARHYLWRFWQRLPPAGQIGIFDRSWYGRVMVERVEGFATEEEWRRAYREIVEFESQLIHAGYVVLKFWLHISQEEQLHRFEARRDDPFKRHKLTDEDWRNRKKFDQYYVAVNQMLQRTHTATAPWTVIPGNDKYFARVRVIETVAEAVKAAVKQKSHDH